MNLAELIAALRKIAQYLEWSRESMEDFHAFAHQFNCTPGGDVFDFVLQDALRYRNMTLDQLREAKSEMYANPSSRKPHNRP